MPDLAPPSLLDLGMRLHVPYNNDFGLEAASDVSNTIDQLYLKNRDELERIEQIPLKAPRNAALAEYYYAIKDYENAALFASNLVDLDPTMPDIWGLLLQSLKNIGDAARFAKYLNQREKMQKHDAAGVAESQQVVRRTETEKFRVHPVSKRLLVLIDGLGGSYRIERSFRLERNRFLCNSFIVTVPLDSSDPSRNQEVMAICRALAIPETCNDLVGRQMSAAVKIHFGFEEGERHSLLKVYLEFAYDHSRQLQAGAAGSEPWLLLLGFKWDPYAPSGCVISRYSGLPTYTPRQIHAKIASKFTNLHGGGIIMPFTTEILKMCDARIPNRLMWYLDVTEEGTSRPSFDVKTYRARLQLRHLRPLLRDACKHLHIPEQQFEVYLDTVKDHKFGHLSCGIARDGEEYLTIYHEASGQ